MYLWPPSHANLFVVSRSTFDLLTVNETAQEPPSDDADNKLNTPAALAIEATWINQMFKEQVCGAAFGRVHEVLIDNMVRVLRLAV